MFRYNFRKYLTELGITMNTNILVAVSGGIDSMSLLDILKNCSLNLNIFVANVNFNLRGQESNQDTQMVIDYCQNLNIKLFTKSFNTIQYAKEKNISIEMAARELRYNWFFELMEQHNLTYLAIAHNSNDNAETLLLNLTRGTGIDGITGIKEILPINNNKFIIRPLLQYTRDEIEKYATKYNIPFRTDSTNQLSDYHRNRIRNEVFPQLKKINPSVIKTFNRNIKHFTQANNVLNTIIAEKINEYCNNYNTYTQLQESSYAKTLHPLNLRFNKYSNNQSHLSCTIDIKKLLPDNNWEFWLYNILKNYNFLPLVIEDICNSIKDLCEKDNQTKKFLSGGKYIAVRERGMIKIYKEISTDTEEKSFEFLSGEDFINKTIELNSIKIKSSLISYQEWEKEKAESTLCTYLDFDKIKFPINFHTIKAGEKFSPYGLKGNKKITDYLTDIKFENIYKNKVIALYNKDNQAISIIGLQIDNSVKISYKTKIILKLEII